MLNRKKIYVTVLMLLFINLCFSGIFSHSSSAAIGPIIPPQITENPGVTQELDYFNTRNYFEHLTQNFIRNYEGYCSYVSLGILLSYYDTFLNGAIIPEHYENNASIVSEGNLYAADFESPGVKRNEKMYYDMGYDTLENYAYGEKDNNYFPFMVYHHGITDRFTSSTSMLKYQAMLNSMFSDTGFGFDVNIVESSSSDTSKNQAVIKNQMINQLNQGKILILEMLIPGVAAHSLIVYNYENSKFFTHDGLNKPTELNYIPFVDTFHRFDRFCTIDVNFLHNNHSNNYLVNGIGYCGDGHHYHDYTFTQYNDKKHVRRCYCGLVEFAVHQVEGPSTQQFQRCIFCNALVDTFNTGVNGQYPPVAQLGIQN